jgi:hypothetical protein
MIKFGLAFKAEQGWTGILTTMFTHTWDFSYTSFEYATMAIISIIMQIGKIS